MLALLDRFIIMDDVELADISDERLGLLVAGPEAAQRLDGLGLLPESLMDGNAGAAAQGEVLWQGASVRVVQLPAKVVPRFELWAEAAIAERLLTELVGAGAVEGDAQSVEWLRLLEGTPKFGADIRERELPQETGQTDALHFSKGCYLGQEIVERIRSRGNVHRVFGGFVLEGVLPEVATTLEADGKVVGELTSVARVPAFGGYPDGLMLGLGYVRRETLELKREIMFAGGRASPIALPLPLSR